MATVLYRLGKFAFRSRRLVASVWLAVVVAVGLGAATLSGNSSDSFSIPGTESQEAIDLLEERFPEAAADGANARVVFVAPDGEQLADYASAVGDVLTTIADGPQVDSVVNPLDAQLISPNGRMGLANVTFSAGFIELDAETRDLLFDAAEAGRDQGLTVELGGDAIEQVPEIGTELIGLAVAALVLIITFGSLVAASMPLVTGVTGLLIGLAAITAATGFMEIGSTSPTLAVMLGLAVGIDYALFIVSRYRHEVRNGGRVANQGGDPGEEAAGRAVSTAGTAVVFAGLTVMIALAGLWVIGIPILTEMGLAAALTVAIAVAIALTLLPALLGFAGWRILGWRVPGLKQPDPEDDSRRTLGRRWVELIVRRPLVVLAAAIVGLAAVALPVLDMRLGLPDEGTYPSDTTQRKAYDHIAHGFGPGFNGPLTVVVDGSGTAYPQGAADSAFTAISELDGVGAVEQPQFNAAGDTAIIGVVPSTGPAAEETNDLVSAIRSEVDGSVDAPVIVTGMTAIFIDFNEKMGAALAPYLLVVVGLSVILLMLVFRSIVVPIKAALGFLLSVAATFGALVAVFQWGWLEGIGIDATGMVISILPIVIVGVVFGLAMDYEVFLVTRMREEHVHGADASQAVTIGYQHGARVVAAAATIMFSVFAGFVLGDASDIVQMGFALAAAIVFDAFVVRMTIVPAVMALMGECTWRLPRWLDRALPNVDVEGERLTRRLEKVAAID